MRIGLREAICLIDDILSEQTKLYLLSLGQKLKRCSNKKTCVSETIPTSVPHKMRSLIGSRYNCEMRLLPERERSWSYTCNSLLRGGRRTAARRSGRGNPRRIDFSSDFISFLWGDQTKKGGFHHVSSLQADSSALRHGLD